MVAAATAQDLPTLPGPDRLLFTRFIALNLDLPALARDSGRPLTDLLQWAVSEPIQAYLAIHQLFRRQSAQAKTYTSYETATEALVKALETATDPAEIRRIAEAILRAAARLLPPAPRSRPAKARDNPDPTEPEPNPAPTPEPAATAAVPDRPAPKRCPAPATAPSAAVLPTSTPPTLACASPPRRDNPAARPPHAPFPGLNFPVEPPLGLPSGPILIPVSPARRTPASLAAAAGTPGPAP